MLVQRQVRPLPALVYDFSEIGTALRQFSAAKHVGKVVVRGPVSGAAAAGQPRAETAEESSAAWVVTGGLGALGSLAAEWLVGQGVRNIYLLGRSGR